MKVLAIRGENIASLERFALDFTQEPLRSAGIFAIVGPTGSGKSSLLDCLCLALYHDVPRLQGVSRLDETEARIIGGMQQGDRRNLLRKGHSNGYAEVDFLAHDGKSYRARWGMRAAMRKGSKSQEECSLSELTSGQLLLSGKTSEIRSRIVNLVGLDFGQFTRTVLLAQGGFAEFLKADPNLRSELLEKLTGTSIYSRIGTGVFERSKTEQAKLRDLELKLQGTELLSDLERTELEGNLTRLQGWLAKANPQLEELTRLRDAVVQRREWLTKKVTTEQELASIAGQRPTLETGLQRSLSDLSAHQNHIETMQKILQEAEALDLQVAAAQTATESSKQALAEAERRLSAAQEKQKKLAQDLGNAQASVLQDQEWLRAKSKWASVAEQWSLCADALRRAESLQQELSGLKNLPSKEVTECRALLGMTDSATLADQDRALRREAEELRQAEEQTTSESEGEQIAHKLIQNRQDQSLTARIATEQHATVETLRNVVNRLSIQTAQNVQSLRANLQPGTSCPVCGSTHHPLLEGHSGLAEVEQQFQQMFASERVRLNEAEILERETQKRLATLEAAIHSAQERLAELAAQRKDLPEAIASATAGLDINERLVWIRNRKQRCVQDLEHTASLQQVALRLERSLSLLRSEDALNQLHAQVRDWVQEALPEWQKLWNQNIPMLSATLRAAVEEWNRHQSLVEENHKKLDALTVQKQSSAEAVEQEQTHAAGAHLQAQQAQEQWSSLQTKRAQVLEGRSANDVRKALDGQAKALQQTVDQAQAALSALSTRMAATEGVLQSLTGQIEVAAEMISGLRTTWQVNEDEEDARLARAQGEHQSNNAEAARLQLRLDQDQKQRNVAQELAQQVTQQKDSVDIWSRLSELIGSADGKAFRAVAQLYTLRQLLVIANRQLAQMAPRYRLKPLGESLHLLVEDHDLGGELRPIHTLSGGETFLVSLALALALAEMDSAGLQLESLFIDEGFGTLDPETLRMVLSALGTLHAQGRQVGLVTHVEEMKEQIAVRIEVTRKGAGRSSVAVRV